DLRDHAAVVVLLAPCDGAGERGLRLLLPAEPPQQGAQPQRGPGPVALAVALVLAAPLGLPVQLAGALVLASGLAQGAQVEQGLAVQSAVAAFDQPLERLRGPFRVALLLAQPSQGEARLRLVPGAFGVLLLPFPPVDAAAVLD